ncbi:unnamed protein product [Urochloa decumbens]|uniref:Uncharacterized protein n=1 Tax=Urochloa decumbens TaxID=240449 RepID=A0ABC8WTB7_9POAL
MEEPPPRFFSDIFPENHADVSWVPDGMDPNSSYRLAVRVGAYVKLTDDDGCEYCKLHIMRQQGTEAIAKLNGASGVYMLHNGLMEGSGSRKRLLEFEGSIELVECARLSPVAFMEKGKAKKLKVVMSKKE